MTNQNNGKYLPRGRKRRKNSPVSRLLLVVALVSALIFGVTVFSALRSRIALKRMAAEAAQETTQASTAALTEPTVPVQTQSTVPPITAATTPPTEPREILPRFLELYQKNPDLAGWLTIPGTRIDYPVMYSPDEPERYLHANFDIDYSFAGLPFLDAACDTESGNRIIYAHNMLDGSMFRSLPKYESKSYWQAHPTIHFDTLYEEGEYEVLAAFYDRVYYTYENCFKFYQFIDAADEADFNNAISNFRSKALYDTGVTAAYGDKLITLVTCAYHVEDGRFVVVARKK